MAVTHRDRVEELLTRAAAEHESLVSRLPADLRESLPVDAQGLTRAIDHLAAAAGWSEDERRSLVRPHAVNPAVLHARVFGAAPLTRETVLASFVEGARVRADALTVLADAVGGPPLVNRLQTTLAAYPPPIDANGPDALADLQATYAAQERAVIMIACSLDQRTRA